MKQYEMDLLTSNQVFCLSPRSSPEGFCPEHAAFLPVRILRSNEENIKKNGVIHRANV